MNADEELKQALKERLDKETIFFNHLKKAIKDAVNRFDRCDTSTSPEVEESVNVSIAGLQEATRRLKEETILNKEKVRDIKDWFTGVAQENHLVQDSTHTTIPQWFTAPVATPAPPPPAATPIVTGTPAPRSVLDRVKGFFGRPDPGWIGNANAPVAPIYQAEPVNPYAKGGKRTRKYRRRV